MKKPESSKEYNRVISTIRSTTKSDEPPPVLSPITYPNSQLMQALYFTWDGFERAMMNMFLVYKTAEDVLQHKQLEGDRITVGARNNEWRAGSTTILKNFIGEPVKKTEQYEQFKNPFNEVPIYVYLFDDDPCIINTAQVYYEREYFMLPNTYREFINKFGVHP